MIDENRNNVLLQHNGDISPQTSHTMHTRRLIVTMMTTMMMMMMMITTVAEGASAPHILFLLIDDLGWNGL